MDEMEGKIGIEETAELVDLAAGLGVAAYNMLQDGKISLGDYLYLIPVLPLLGPAVGGISKVPAEIKDIDPEEVDILIARTKGKFDIPFECVEEFVENCLEIGLKVFRNIQLLKECRG